MESNVSSLIEYLGRAPTNDLMMRPLSDSSTSEPMSTPSVTYRLLPPREKILKRPEELAGSTVTAERVVWIVEDTVTSTNGDTISSPLPTPIDNDSSTTPLASPSTMVPIIVNQRVKDYNPVLVKIVAEILDNAKDNYLRHAGTPFATRTIRVDIDPETHQVSVWNDGMWIPVRIHEFIEGEELPSNIDPKQDHYEASLIFGTVNSSSTYDDNGETDGSDPNARRGVGLNGVGGKLTNIFSTRFEIETADPEAQKQLNQVWFDNMKTASPPTIVPYTAKTGYTKVTFMPDFKRFKLVRFTPGMLAAIRKMCVDASMTIQGGKVVFNGELIQPIKSFKDYVLRYYYPTIDTKKLKLLHYTTKDSEIVVVQDPNLGGGGSSKRTDDDDDGDDVIGNGGESETLPNGNVNVSFVNGSCTGRGGVHVDAWMDSIFRPLAEAVRAKFNTKYAQKTLYSYFSMFIKTDLSNPTFEDGNLKQMLSRPLPTTVVTTDADVKKMMRWEFIDAIGDQLRLLDMSALSKIDGKKKLNKLPDKLVDAHEAGKARSRDCVLIIVEGDSAQELAVQARGYIENGPTLYGVMSVFGKLVNVRNVKTWSTVVKNEVIKTIVTSIGLTNGMDYSIESNMDTLRYGSVRIMTDADHDGNHIKGLILNYFQQCHPTLFARGFLFAYRTCIVKAWPRGKPSQAKLFLTLREYRKWVDEQTRLGKPYSHKYYKGLGSIDDTEIEEILAGALNVGFVKDTHADEALSKAFNGKRADDRKVWLANYTPPSDNDTDLATNVNIQPESTIEVSKFIDTELIEYSLAACVRAVPSMVDGLKKGQRKVIWCANKVLRQQRTKVSQFAGECSKHSDYDHGEQSLMDTIVKMAMTFVGSNNIPWLDKEGQFGTRLLGCKKASSPRYIYVKSFALIRKILRREDDSLLDYNDCDGVPIEPKYYVPIIPMLLVNGCDGIGTGWSSKVAQHDPLVLVEWIKAWLNGVEANDRPRIVPWARGFTGKIEMNDRTGEVTSYGSCVPVTRAKNQVGYKITELPVGTWTVPWMKDIQKRFVEKGWIKSETDVKLGADVDRVDVTIESGYSFTPKQLNLVTKNRYTNMVAFDSNHRIRKYARQTDIMEEFCQVRLEFYKRRIARRIDDLNDQLPELESKIRFAREVLEDVDLLKQTEEELFEYFRASGGYYYKTAVSTGHVSASMSDDEDDAEIENGDDVDNDAEIEIVDGDDTDSQTSDINQDDTTTTANDGTGYRYLTDMPTRSLTKNGLEKLIAKYELIKNEIKTLEITNPAELWIRELDEFVKDYTQWARRIEAMELKSSRKRKRSSETSSLGPVPKTKPSAGRKTSTPADGNGVKRLATAKK